MTRIVTPLVALAWLGIIGGGIATMTDSRVNLPWWSFVALAVLVVAALVVTAQRHRAEDAVTIGAAVLGAAAAITLFVQIDVYTRYPLLFAGLCLLVAGLSGAFSRSERTPRRTLADARS